MADDNSEHTYSNGLIASGSLENIYDELQSHVEEIIENDRGFVLMMPKERNGVPGLVILTSSDAAGTLAVLRDALNMMKITES